MNDQNDPNNVSTSQPDNQPVVTPPVEESSVEEAIVSSTPLTPKPGEVVRPAKKLNAADILAEDTSVAPTIPVPPVVPTVADKPAADMPPVVTPPVSAEVPKAPVPEPVLETPVVSAPEVPVVPTSEVSTTPVPEIPVSPAPPVVTEEPVVAVPSAAPEVSIPSAEQPVVTEIPQPEEASLPTEKPKKSHKGLIIGIVLFLLFLVGGSAAVYMIYFSDMKPEVPVEEEVVEETTDSEEIAEPEDKDTTSVKYLDILFKDLDDPVQELRSDTEFEDIMNIGSRSEF